MVKDVINNSKYLVWVELFRKKNNKWVIFLAQRSPYGLHHFNNFVNIVDSS